MSRYYAPRRKALRRVTAGMQHTTALLLDEFGFASLGLTQQDFLDPDVVIQLGYEPNRVDFITKLSGVAFADAYPTRTLMKFGTLEVLVIECR